MKDPPTDKRQDQEDQEPGALISPTEQITVPRQPITIYPLRISSLEPTRRLTEAMARSVKSPLPTSTRQYQIKRLYEKHLYDVCEEAKHDWTHAIKFHQEAHFEYKHDYLKNQSGSSDSVSAKRQAYRQYATSDKILR